MDIIKFTQFNHFNKILVGKRRTKSIVLGLCASFSMFSSIITLSFGAWPTFDLVCGTAAATMKVRK